MVEQVVASLKAVAAAVDAVFFAHEKGAVGMLPPCSYGHGSGLNVAPDGKQKFLKHQLDKLPK